MTHPSNLASSVCGVFAASAIVLVTGPAMARHRHHRAPAVPHEAAAPVADWGHWQAEANARAQARQEAAPGLTKELAPDARETATGGPVGGIPGFDGF